MPPAQLNVLLVVLVLATHASAQEKVERRVRDSSSLWVEGKHEVEGGYRIDSRPRTRRRRSSRCSTSASRPRRDRT